MAKSSPQSLKRNISCGACALCGTSDIAKRSIVKHLDACQKRATGTAGREATFHLMAWSPDDTRYWLYFEAPASAGVRVIDAFLRTTWLECCGHMSSFTIDGQRYVAPSQGAAREYGDRTMKARLDEILRPGMRFLHEYGFGSTTELALEVIARGAPYAKADSVRLLAQNDPPDIRCKTCGNPAATICVECQEEVEGPEDVGKIYYCDHCIDSRSRHRHDDAQMRLPVVNSPRMGVCGYTG